MVTAGHCVQDKGAEKPLNPKNTFFLVGKHNLDSTHEEDYETCSIDKFVIHPHWLGNLNLKSYDGDIAIAFLKNPLKFTKTIQPSRKNF